MRLEMMVFARVAQKLVVMRRLVWQALFLIFCLSSISISYAGCDLNAIGDAKCAQADITGSSHNFLPIDKYAISFYARVDNNSFCECDGAN